MNKINIALTGNPNSGKTTIFNNITGARQKVGNWSGVTVDIKQGEKTYNNYKLTVTDLPGTYSLNTFSEEERIASDYILNNNTDVIIDIIDSTNLERNLYLAIQLIEMGKKIILNFNMIDELEKKGYIIDFKQLSILFGVPIVKTIGRINQGTENLLNMVIAVYEEKYKKSHESKISYGKEIENEINKISDIIKNINTKINLPLRWYAIKLLEQDNKIIKLFNNEDLNNQVKKSISKLESFFNDDIKTILSEKRYGYITGALKECVKKKHLNRRDISEKIDKFITNKYLAYPVFAIFMWLLFQATFSLGEYPTDWISSFVEWLQNIIINNFKPNFIRDLIVYGIISGTGGVLVFLPNIIILFLGLAIMEDSGYMARAAFIMDKIMHKIGLHGKSSIPLIMGLGCNVPAILATRTLESKRDRILTILISPLISCSARFPVYLLLAAAFFPKNAGNIIFVIYAISFAFTFIVGFVLNRIRTKKEEYPFVMELPPYRIPTLKSISLHMWDKVKHYLARIGGVVLVFSVILWFLGNYPKNPENYLYKQRIAGLQKEISRIKNKNNSKYMNKIKILKETKDIQNEKNIEYTFIGRFGKFIEPVLKPIGFDWKIGVTLISGFVAKEIIVGSMGVLYNTGEEGTKSLQQILKKLYVPLQGFILMIFVLLYTPCMATVITMYKEIKSIKWFFVGLIYPILLAWGVSFLIFQVGKLFNYI